ncbi:MAG: VOC family protein [Solirubrobacteraceae bacterium]
MTASSTRPELLALEIADPPEQWEALGFSVSSDQMIELGGVQLRLGADGEGIVAWTLRGIDETSAIDGLPTRVIDQSVGGDGERRQHGPRDHAHPNGAVAVDHVVILTPDFDRTADAVAAAGMPLRRLAERHGARQGFRRLGPAIMEIVQAPDGPTRFWGLVVIVSDLDALAERLGDLLREIRPAVQPGRRIAPLRSKAGLGPAVAFMDPS